MERFVDVATVTPSTQVDEYLAVGVDGELTSATGDSVYGIVRTGNCAANATAEVVVKGECYAKVGENVSAEDWLVGGAGGKLMKARQTIDFTAETYTLDRSHIVALEDGSANDIIRVRIM